MSTWGHPLREDLGIPTGPEEWMSLSRPPAAALRSRSWSVVTSSTDCSPNGGVSPSRLMILHAASNSSISTSIPTCCSGVRAPRHPDATFPCEPGIRAGNERGFGTAEAATERAHHAPPARPRCGDCHPLARLARASVRLRPAPAIPAQGRRQTLHRGRGPAEFPNARLRPASGGPACDRARTTLRRRPNATLRRRSDRGNRPSERVDPGYGQYQGLFGIRRTARTELELRPRDARTPRNSRPEHALARFTHGADDDPHLVLFGDLLAAGRSSAVTWFGVREVKKPMAPASTAAFAAHTCAPPRPVSSDR